MFNAAPYCTTWGLVIWPPRALWVKGERWALGALSGMLFDPVLEDAAGEAQGAGGP